MTARDDQASTPTSSPGLWAIFKAFFVIGVTAFGGGASAHIHHAVVHREKWLDEARMLEGMTLARVIPGTNVSNLAAFVGALLAGYQGAAVALIGVALPGAVAIVALAIGYASVIAHADAARAGMHGLTAGAVGIMGSLVVNAAKPVRKAPAGLLLALAAFVGVAVLELNMLLVLAVLLPVGWWVGPKERAT